MSNDDLRGGLMQLADDVALGIEPARIRGLGRRQRRRRQALAALTAATLVPVGAVVIQHRHSTAAATLGQGPNAIALPDWVRGGMQKDVGDQEFGYGLAQRAVGSSTLVLVGLRGPARACDVYFVPDHESAGWGASCNNSDATLDRQGVSLGGGGSSDSDGHADFVLYGSGPADTTTFALRAPGGRTLTVVGQHAPTDWDNRVYFVAPWVDGATAVQAIDQHGTVLGCSILGSDEKC